MAYCIDKSELYCQFKLLLMQFRNKLQFTNLIIDYTDYTDDIDDRQ